MEKENNIPSIQSPRDSQRAKDELSFQDELRKEKPIVQGSMVKYFGDLLKEANDLLEEERKLHPENEEAILEKAEKLGIEEDEIRKIFATSFRLTMKANQRTGILNKDSSEEDLRYLLGAHTLSFRSLLSYLVRQNSKKDGFIFPRTAMLRVLECVYVISPKIIEELRDKYAGNEEVRDWMIKRVVMSNVVDPEGELEDALKRIEFLKKEYAGNSEVDGHIIRDVALSKPNKMVETINGILKRIDYLKQKYANNPDVKKWMIRYAAINKTRDLEKVIDRLLAKGVGLKDKEEVSDEFLDELSSDDDKDLE